MKIIILQFQKEGNLQFNILITDSRKYFYNRFVNRAMSLKLTTAHTIQRIIYIVLNFLDLIQPIDILPFEYGKPLFKADLCFCLLDLKMDSNMSNGKAIIQLHVSKTLLIRSFVFILKKKTVFQRVARVVKLFLYNMRVTKNIFSSNIFSNYISLL